MRALRLRILRLSIAVCLALGVALPAAAGADGPPYSDGSIPDGVAACNGTPYDVVERDGDLYVRCWGGVPGNDWTVFTTAASLSGTTATVTVARAHARAPALVSYATEPGTASAGVDYTTTTGRVYFAAGQTAGSFTVPLAAFPPPPGTPARSFTVTFGDPVGLGLTVPTATVDLPAVVTPVPAPTIVHGPSPTTPLRSGTIEFTGDPEASFECRLDSQAFQACVSPWLRSSVALGAHRFEVRQSVDGVQSAVAAHTWTVAGNPDPGYPGGPPYSPAGRLDADEACDGGLFDIVTWNGNRYVRCFGGAALGWQTFSASAATVVGATATVTVRRSSATGAPELIGFRTRPGTALAGTDYTANEGELYFAPGVTERTLTIPLVRDPQATDDKRFALTFFDSRRSGITMPDDVTVTIPARPEPPAITAGPQAPTVLSTASFSFSGETGASFECRLDDAVFAACTSAKAYSGVAPGTHRFEVRQRATYGAVSNATAREWTVLPSPDPGSAVGPPYAANRTPDGEYACDGGFYSIPTHNGDRYVRCLGGAVGSRGWQKLSAAVVVGETSATITLSRPETAAPALVGFVTEPGTAEAGRDFTATSGELYFRDTVLGRTLTVPIVRDPQASSDRSFTVRLTDTVNLGLGLPPVTITIPGNPPTATAAPTVGGAARVGERLTVADGGWTHEPTGYAYAWERCDAAGDGCVSIADATGATYVPTVGDVGGTLRVAVTASNGSGSATERSEATPVVRAALTAPTLTAGPTGEQILHRATFGFTGESGATFECRRDDAEFAPCASPHTLTQLPAGEHRFEVRQRATDDVVSVPVVREWTVRPSPDPGYPTAPPYGFLIDGFSSCEGASFTLSTHNGDRFVRCLDEPGALAWQRFTADVAVDGNTATVTVTRDGDGGPALIGFGTRDGSAVDGTDYTATEGELFFAQGVRSRTLEIPVVRDPDADSDRSFAVRLRDILELNLRVEDAAVTIPGNRPTLTTPPAIDGVARVGHTLTATAGEWTHQPTGYARTWERCDAAGSGCEPIADATGTTYESGAADVGARLRVAVAATNGSGTTVERSAPSAVVRAVLDAPTVTGGPEGETEATSASFAFTGEVGARFECRRDDGEYAACASPVAFAALGLGEHRLAVRQVADDGVVSSEAVRRWTVVAPVVPPEPGGEDPPGPGPGDQPPVGLGPSPLPPPGLSEPPTNAPAPRAPVRMTTIRLELRFCRGCTTLTVQDRKRLQRLRGRVDGSRLLAIDGYGDRGRSRAANRRLAQARARAVERVLVSGVEHRPARRMVVAHDRLVRAETSSAARDTKRGGRPAERIVTVRVVHRR